jgi:hypothetical protein
LRRDGLQKLFTVVALADFVGVEKPDEGIFLYALNKAGVSPGRAVHVGNRLESDIRPAQRLGMRTVWLLRGDAPPAPTLDQLAEPDAVITSLVGLPTALSRLTGSTAFESSSAVSAVAASFGRGPNETSVKWARHENMAGKKIPDTPRADALPRQ